MFLKEALRDQLFFYLDYAPLLLLTYRNERVNCLRKRVTDQIFGNASVLIIMTYFIWRACPYVMVCCAHGCAGRTAKRSCIRAPYHSEEYAVSKKWSIRLAAIRNGFHGTRFSLSELLDEDFCFAAKLCWKRLHRKAQYTVSFTGVVLSWATCIVLQCQRWQGTESSFTAATKWGLRWILGIPCRWLQCISIYKVRIPSRKIDNRR